MRGSGHPVSTLLADPVAGRLVVADPEVPTAGWRRRERPVRVADLVRASDADAVAPDQRRVVPALLSGGAGIRRVVVILRLARPRRHDVARRPVAGRSAGGDVLAALTAPRIVLIKAAIGPRLRDARGVRGPGQFRKGRRRGRPGGVAEPV